MHNPHQSLQCRLGVQGRGSFLQPLPLDGRLLGTPEEPGIHAVHDGSPVLPGCQPICKRVLETDDHNLVISNTKPGAPLAIPQRLTSELDEHLPCLVQPVASLPGKPRLPERHGHVPRHATHQIEVTGNVRAADVQLDGRATHQHRLGAHRKQALQPGDQPGRPCRPLRPLKDRGKLHLSQVITCIRSPQGRASCRSVTFLLVIGVCAPARQRKSVKSDGSGIEGRARSPSTSACAARSALAARPS